MKLTKKIPSRLKVARFSWCKQDWMVMSEGYRAIRKRMAPMDKCYWCNYKFKNGDMISLACEKEVGNKVLCHDCAVELHASKK